MLAPARPSARRSESRARVSSGAETARGGQKTAACQADMWLMRVADFLTLETLEPHQEMRAQNKLVRWHPACRRL